MYSVYKGSYSLVVALLECGVNLDLKDSYGVTALIRSADYGELKIMKLLIEAGANWEIKDDNGFDFFDKLEDNQKEKLKNEYTDKYEEFIWKKESEKYNL